MLFEEDPVEKSLRRMSACIHTLSTVADDLVDPEDVDLRADLLVAAENLLDIASYLTDQIRGIAWQHSLTPGERDDLDQ